MSWSNNSEKKAINVKPFYVVTLDVIDSLQQNFIKDQESNNLCACIISCYKKYQFPKWLKWRMVYHKNKIENTYM